MLMKSSNNYAIKDLFLAIYCFLYSVIITVVFLYTFVQIPIQHLSFLWAAVVYYGVGKIRSDGINLTREIFEYRKGRKRA